MRVRKAASARAVTASALPDASTRARYGRSIAAKIRSTCVRYSSVLEPRIRRAAARVRAREPLRCGQLEQQHDVGHRELALAVLRISRQSSPRAP
jgi:hypothetical protein